MAKSADICLVVEGSYPYVTGGVSSWIQWLIQKMADRTFAVVALVAESKDASERKYSFPDNVVAYREFAIFDYREIESARPLRLGKTQWRQLSGKIVRLVGDWHKGALSAESLDFIKEMATVLSPGIFKNFMRDEPAFAVLTRLYEDYRGDAGFVKYFYNYRNIHLIYFRLLSLISRLPEAAVYHSPGTGYGGLLACLRSSVWGGRSIITEHGIYLQEREMELLKSDWLDDPYLKEMWIDSFAAICRWQYACADRLITLYEGNRQLEINYGAAPDRIRVIPNGIDVGRFKRARAPRCRTTPLRVGIVGRVDSVKDIKTFVQAMALIRKSVPEVRGLIIGPTDDQPVYYQECLQLVSLLDLGSAVEFTGRADVIDYYRKMDLLMLTSIKEAMPLVIMEAMASGIPAVATDVGACRELIYGVDDGIGAAGIVARIMDAKALAEAAVRILLNPQKANAFAANGIERIERFYREEIVIDQYRTIYTEALGDRHHLSAG